MKKGFAILLAALLLCVLLLPASSIADLGDFSGGSDFGGGSDWGGSDWGGSSWSSSDWSDSDSDSSGGIGIFPLFCGGSGGFWGFALLIALIFLVMMTTSMRKRKPGASAVPGAARTPDSKLTPIARYPELDPNFSEEKMKEQLSNLYIKMQDCCTARDVEPIRPYFADSLYQQFDRQVKKHRAQHITNYVERIAVLDVTLRGYYQENGSDVIVAELYTRITDYTLNDDTGALVAGDRNAEKFMTYEYLLSRPTGKITDPEHAGVSERHCPNCGAPLSVNESIKCPYCGSVLTFSDHEWTVHAIKGIRQQTAK